jgi:hypothetical protein
MQPTQPSSDFAPVRYVVTYIQFPRKKSFLHVLSASWVAVVIGPRMQLLKCFFCELFRIAFLMSEPLNIVFPRSMTPKIFLASSLFGRRGSQNCDMQVMSIAKRRIFVGRPIFILCAHVTSPQARARSEISKQGQDKNEKASPISFCVKPKIQNIRAHICCHPKNRHHPVGLRKLQYYSHEYSEVVLLATGLMILAGSLTKVWNLVIKVMRAKHRTLAMPWRTFSTKADLCVQFSDMCHLVRVCSLVSPPRRFTAHSLVAGCGCVR